MTTAKTRKAFSLMELMIAIMILGIGMVMVATVFPVGLDISRETIQMSLTQAISDSAIATLRVKVPVYKEMDNVYPNPAPVDMLLQTTHRVLVPDVRNTDLDADMIAEDYQVWDSLQVRPLPPSNKYDLVPVSYPNWDPGWMSITPFSRIDGPLDPPLVSQFMTRTRAFTERTGWAGELNRWDFTSVLPTQNLRPDYITLVADYLSGGPTKLEDIIPTMIAPSLEGLYRADFPRVHLADQVYPPITSYYQYKGITYDRWEISPPDPKLLAHVPSFFEELASRRYSWTAIHHRMSTELTNVSQRADRNMLATIVITHRGDLNERYARQAELSRDPTPSYYDINFNLGFPEDKEDLYQPQPDVEAQDRLFPRPWLVMLNAVNVETGEIGCSGEVARLLPEGSYFIVAATNNTFVAGTSYKVRTCMWTTDNMYPNYDAMDDKTWARLEINRGVGAGVFDLLVWVFPPAVDRDMDRFKTRSPVVGVATRVVEVPQ